jgi:hypothetical protein
MEIIFEKTVAAFSLGVLIFFIIFCIQPFKFFYRRARLSLVITLWQIVISPFGQVKFRHFFLADILTSMTQPLRDLGYISCFFFQGSWLDQSDPSVEQCPLLEDYILSVAFLPFWFRLAQCFRRYYDCKQRVHLINAGKYFSVILVHFTNVLRVKVQSNETMALFILMSFASSCFSYCWDIYMDWGLLRAPWSDPEKALLRPKILFPKWFYYYAAASNLVLRFLWVLPFIPMIITIPHWKLATQGLLIIVTVGEGFRRA